VKKLYIAFAIVLANRSISGFGSGSGNS